MNVSPIHAFRQGSVVAALFKTVTSGAKKKKGSKQKVEAPGPVLTETVPPRHPALVKDYIRHVGGSPGWYKGTLPGHMFPQWGFPIMSRVIRALPYDVTRILNAGCKVTINQALPVNKPLKLRANLQEVDDNGSRALFMQRMITGTDQFPDALVCEVSAVMPYGSKKKKAKKEKPRVPDNAREIAQWRLSANCGLEFAVLTGDFNPVHWIRPYAKMSGFKNTILHGYSTLARAIESLNRYLWSGRSDRLFEIDVRFTRPLVLPARLGVFIDGQGGIFVGDAPGGPAYLTGTFTSRKESSL